MKNLKFLIIALLVVSYSCNDAIDIEQVGRLGPEQAFESVDDLEAGMLGVYNEFDYTPQIQFNAVFTDEVRIGFDNGGQGIGNGEYGFRLNPGSAAPQAIWVNFNSAINAANRVIEAAGLVEVEEDEQERYENILGQVYALRAWAYTELFVYFSADYTDDAALATILFDFIPEIDQQLPRNTVGEIVGLINADLAEAETLLNDEQGTIYVSQDFVTALRARIAAYRQDYATADALAADLLTRYPIATPGQYLDMFQDTDDTEIIFKLERTIGDSYDQQGSTGSGFAGGWAGANFAFVNSSIDGSPYFEMSEGLLGALQGGDLRINVLLDPTATADILAIGKYQGSEGQPLMNDLKIFRSSEMLLIRAEAAVASNNLGAAAGFIDQLVDQRYGTDQATPVYANQQEAYLNILNERRIEFAYEGHRWVDLKRLGARAGVSGIQRNANDCEINGACSLPIDDFRFTMPIPLVELNANGNIQQNDGY